LCLRSRHAALAGRSIIAVRNGGQIVSRAQNWSVSANVQVDSEGYSEIITDVDLVGCDIPFRMV
jgi:hypothetical protein